MYNANNMDLNVQININANNRQKSGSLCITLLHHILLLNDISQQSHNSFQFYSMFFIWICMNFAHHFYCMYNIRFCMYETHDYRSIWNMPISLLFFKLSEFYFKLKVFRKPHPNQFGILHIELLNNHSICFLKYF